MPTNLGPYEIRGELGRGAMAVVWRAWDPSLQREVAIKEPVRTAGMSDWLANELSSRFLVEGHASARLNHPNIITVYAADTFDGRPAIVMELLEGSTLSEIIDRKQLTPERILSIWSQLLEALIYAHSMGVVHRDIKPDNIFITKNDLVKLTDFGVAHFDTGPTLGQDRVVAGSPGYMSPEQAAGEVADARSDLFSFSVIAYEMLALNNPFGATEGLTRDELIFRTQASETLAPFEAIPDISAVIAKGLKQHPKDRWQTGQHYLNALTKAMDNERYIFMSQRKGRPLALRKEGSNPTGTELFTMTTPATNRNNLYIGVASGALVLVGFFGIAGGMEFIAILAFVGLILLLGGWALYANKEKLTPGAKTPVAANQLLGDYGGSSSYDLLMPTTNKQLSLRITSPSGQSMDVYVETPITIGRDRVLGNEVLTDGRISASHLSLEYEFGQFIITDLGSTNGTLLNGKPLIGAEPINEGSKIQIGDTIISVIGI